GVGGYENGGRLQNDDGAGGPGARGREAIERGRGGEADGGKRTEQQHVVQPEERDVPDRELPEDAGNDRAGDRAGQQRHDRDADESERRHEEREVERAAGERPRQDDLERASLPLTGDRGRREADGEHRRQDERDRVDQTERDGSRQAEDIPVAEPGELARQNAAFEDRPELRSEPGVDDRRKAAPGEQRDRDEGELDALQTPRM